MNLEIPYWIVYSDYQNALVWSCFDYYKTFHVEYFWILSRSPKLSDEKIEQLLTILSDFGVNTSFYVLADQSNCSNITLIP